MCLAMQANTLRRPLLRAGETNIGCVNGWPRATQDDGHLHHVFEFAGVTRPVVFEETINGGRVENFQSRIFICADAGYEMAGEVRNVFGAVAQGFESDAEDIEAVVEILAKKAFFDALREVEIGGGDYTNVETDSLITAEPFDFFFLKDAQQLRLNGEGHISNFVKEYGSVIGAFKLAGARLDSSCESAFDVSEQLGFEQRVGDCTAVDGDPGSATA